jgi:hypothetical protein
MCFLLLELVTMFKSYLSGFLCFIARHLRVFLHLPLSKALLDLYSYSNLYFTTMLFMVPLSHNP